MAQLQKRMRHAPMHAIWRPASGKGACYVGNMQASQDTKLLKEHGITHIVNCMQRPRLNKHRDSLGIEYHDFDVEGWVFQVTDNKGDGRAAALADEEQEDEQEEVLWPCIHEDEEEERRYRRSQLQAAAEPEATDGARARDFFAPAMGFIRGAVASGGPDPLLRRCAPRGHDGHRLSH